jgi:hypothetical protein
MHHLMRDLLARQAREREQLDQRIEVSDDLIDAGCPEWLTTSANIGSGYKGCGYQFTVGFGRNLQPSHMLAIAETRLPAEPIQLFQHSLLCPIGGLGELYTSMVRPTERVGPVYIEVNDPILPATLNWFVKAGSRILLLSLIIPEHLYPLAKIGYRKVVRASEPANLPEYERPPLHQTWMYPVDRTVSFKLITFPPAGINDPLNYRLHLESDTPSDAIRELFY